MTADNRIRAIHHLIRGLILGSLAFSIARLSRTGALALYVESETWLAIRLAALILFCLAAGQLHAAQSSLRGRDIQAECGCGAHNAAGGWRQWGLYAVFAVPILLGTWAASSHLESTGGIPSTSDVHLHGASPSHSLHQPDSSLEREN